jgi:hypothetical protein
MHFRIDGEHSNAYRVWLESGAPSEPDVGQIRALREREGLELDAGLQEIEMNDSLSLPIVLPMHGVSLLQLVPENTKPPKKPSWIRAEVETGARGDPQIFLNWKPSSEPDFFHYRLWRKQAREGDYQPLWDDDSFNIAIFVDLKVDKRQTYHYRLQAVNASNVVSPYSEELVITVS